MRRRAIALFSLLVVSLALPAASRGEPPTPELNFLTTVVPKPCAPSPSNRYEMAEAKADGWKAPNFERYPGACQRMRFSYGPIVVKPGQNDVLIQPVTIEKPRYDGFMTRFNPDLVFESGAVPPIEQVHLHHAVWISQPSYGQGPFAAAGEEKTAFNLPRGFGLPMRGDDQWLLLYMVHSALSKPMTVFITYEVDYIPAAKGIELGIKPAHPVWLDVRPGTYPVFNVQRGYGTNGRCTWPREQCAAFDPFGQKIAGQGLPANRPGTDFKIGSSLGTFGTFTSGTLIWAAGHLHPGGLANEIDLVRDGKSARIYTGDAVYWDRKDPTKPGGPPTSWDFSMPVVRSPQWGIKVQPGDILRSNAAYDTTMQSTYEDMGITVMYLAPDLPDGKAAAPGIDPFAAPKDTSVGCVTGGLRAATPTLCDKGVVSHGHLAENDNFGGAEGELQAEKGAATDRVDIAAFVYAPGDLTMVSMTGIPTVKLGSTLSFTNEDALVGIYHTATSCSYPCTGPTGTAFPLADGKSSRGTMLDFDSQEMGYGIPTIGPAKQDIGWQLPITKEAGFKPGEVITYFCRIHPSMRGAFEVES